MITRMEIKVKERSVVLTIEEARELYGELKNIFEEKTPHEFSHQGLHYNEVDGGIREFDPNSSAATSFGQHRMEIFTPLEDDGRKVGK